ncbi:MAG: radical SAM protein [Gaiellales bacterium]|nr:MAG: radical SAM protein [Gaiellales bacterium]
MTIAYRAKGNIYLNITNRCSSDCVFCLKRFTDTVYGYDLRLSREPDLDEILQALELEFLEGPADEVVFVGFGEPTLRLDEVLAVTEWLSLRRVRSRLDTNGHGQLINPDRQVAAELAAAGLDAVSVSLVAHNAEVYNQLCRPIYDKAFRAVVRFAQDCVAAGIQTRLTVVDLPEVDIEACRGIAERIGAGFHVRPLLTPDSEEVRA